MLWIGVFHDELSSKDAFESAKALLELLRSYDITDIDIEFRESVFRRSVGLPLLKLPSNAEPTSNDNKPYNVSSGQIIASRKSPDRDGVLGLFLAKGGKSKDILAVTTCQVLFTPDDADIEFVRRHRNGRRKEVVLMGTSVLNELLESLKSESDDRRSLIEAYESQITKLEEIAAGDVDEDAEDFEAELAETRRLLDKARQEIERYTKFTENMGRCGLPVVGHVVYSPVTSTGTGPHSFTMDYAVIKIHENI